MQVAETGVVLVTAHVIAGEVVQPSVAAEKYAPKVTDDVTSVICELKPPAHDAEESTAGRRTPATHSRVAGHTDWCVRVFTLQESVGVVESKQCE